MEDYIAKLTKNLNKECFKITPDLQGSEDGSTLICGCPFKECALVFTRQDDQWVFQQKLIASDATGGDFFGDSVSISSDGNTALVGASNNDPSGKTQAGAAYVFTRTGSTWSQQQKLVASDSATSNFFGVAVSISSNGCEIKIRNIQDKEYTFTMVDGTWVETTPLQPKGKLTMKLSNLENKVPNDNGFRVYLNNVEVGNIETSTVNTGVGDTDTLVTINTNHMEAIEFLDQDLELAKRAIPGTMVYNIEDRDDIPYRLVVTVERTATEEEFLEA